jgi:hypothetical protein
MAATTILLTVDNFELLPADIVKNREMAAAIPVEGPFQGL